MRSLLTIVFSTIASAALAHPSLAPHEHPHASSLLPDTAILMIGAVLVLGGIALLRFLRQR